MCYSYNIMVATLCYIVWLTTLHCVTQCYLHNMHCGYNVWYYVRLQHVTLRCYVTSHTISSAL